MSRLDTIQSILSKLAEKGVSKVKDSYADIDPETQENLENAGEAAGEGLGWILDKLDRPGRATRAAIGAYQDDMDVADAVMDQLGSDPSDAPSGAEIAEKLGEKYDIQDPAILAALATAADVIDPTMMIPGGSVAKVAKVADKAGDAAKGRKVYDILKQGAKGKTPLDRARQRSGIVVKETAQEAAERKMRENFGKVNVVDDSVKAAGQAPSKELRDSVISGTAKSGSSDVIGTSNMLNDVKKTPDMDVEDKQDILRKLFSE